MSVRVSYCQLYTLYVIFVAFKNRTTIKSSRDIVKTITMIVSTQTKSINPLTYRIMNCVCDVKSNLVFTFVAMKSEIQVGTSGGQFLWVADSTVPTKERRTSKGAISHLQIIILATAIPLQVKCLENKFQISYKVNFQFLIGDFTIETYN